MRNCLRFLAYLAVITSIFSSSAGSFEGFFDAIRQNDASAMAQLLKRGFDPNTRDAKGQAPLVMAIQEGATRVVEAMLASPRTDVEFRNLKDESPLMMAALKGQTELAQRLIARGADVNKPGWAPLHYAATSGSLPMLRLLLEQNAYIDAESPNGTTPLMMAAQYGSEDAAKLLLAEGADPTLRNQHKLTAADFARIAGRSQLATQLEQAQRSRLPKGSW